MVERADSEHSGCQFDSSMYHNKNTIGEEGNGKPPAKTHFSSKTQIFASGFCYARNRVCNAVQFSFQLLYSSSRLSFKCALRESGCRIGYEPTKNELRSLSAVNIQGHQRGGFCIVPKYFILKLFESSSERKNIK